MEKEFSGRRNTRKLLHTYIHSMTWHAHKDNVSRSIFDMLSMFTVSVRYICVLISALEQLKVKEVFVHTGQKKKKKKPCSHPLTSGLCLYWESAQAIFIPSSKHCAVVTGIRGLRLWSAHQHDSWMDPFARLHVAVYRVGTFESGHVHSFPSNSGQRHPVGSEFEGGDEVNTATLLLSAMLL